ncbi:hypothetical protein [Paramaledivibacter caminithermalis]|nr:hypothetical protein [Paramaledivibacter caminithermalis]
MLNSVSSITLKTIIIVVLLLAGGQLYFIIVPKLLDLLKQFFKKNI